MGCGVEGRVGVGEESGEEGDLSEGESGGAGSYAEGWGRGGF